MKCIIVAAISKDGFLTKGDDPNVSSWTSEEDKKFFSDIRAKHKLFVFGKNTYLATRPLPTEGILRVVLTNNPDEYAVEAVPNQLEFYNLTPRQFVEKYENLYNSCLVLGGGRVYEDFLNEGLIDQVFLTIEPVVFGSGVAFNLQCLSNMKLLSSKKLNDSGTILNHYSAFDSK